MPRTYCRFQRACSSPPVARGSYLPDPRDRHRGARPLVLPLFNPYRPSVAIMDDCYSTLKITATVRQYSFESGKATPGDPISQAPGAVIMKQDVDDDNATRQFQEWSRWLRVGDNTRDVTFASLDAKRKEVAELWEKFQNYFPSQGPGADAASSLKGVPTIRTLHKAVVDAKVAWETGKKSGLRRAKDRLFDFLGTMNDLSYLFKFIPAEDKYISLLTGVIASIVKVSVNYTKIAEGFSLAVAEISSDLHLVEGKVELADTELMRKLVVDFYVQVFEFLCHTMSFFMSSKKRAQSAFNANFYDQTVRRMVAGIQTTFNGILAEATLATERRILEISSQIESANEDTARQVQHLSNEIKDVGHNVNKSTERQIQHLSNKVKTVGETVRQMDQKLDAALFHLLVVGNESRQDGPRRIGFKFEEAGKQFEILGVRALSQLNAIDEHDRYDRMSLPKERSMPARKIVQECPDEGVDAEEEAAGAEVASHASEDSDSPCTRYEICEYARGLSPYLEDGREQILNTQRDLIGPLLPNQVLVEMQKWIAASESKMIWIEGAVSNSYGSNLSKAALQIVKITFEARIPCVFLLCKRSFDSAVRGQPPMSTRQTALVALLYSTISQLARLLPPKFERTKELSEGMFERMDGSFASIPVALDIMAALLEHAPPSLIWVVDGLQLVESRETKRYLEDFLKLLRDQADKRIFKVCFTTDGNSMVLGRGLKVSERVAAYQISHRGAGKLLKGSSHISTLRGPN
ncbi:hypothetical protein B0J18DRAFT_421300 [Chaetomium sp. MPI-SDFR-AT-0129]|nr:hypothetical protein B0J18DRAFT_421300 [Chaetomium sp. MPI-SDFR-AT-0129]